MDHTEAIDTKAAERYLLGEVTAAEADLFEEHYFDCRVCAADVRDGAALLESGREIARSERKESTVAPMASRRKNIGKWIPLAAAAVFVIGVGLPMTLQRDAGGPSMEIAAPNSLLTAGTRGGGEQSVTFNGRNVAALYVDIPPEPRFPRYELSLLDARGKTVGVQSLSAQETEQTVPLLLSELPAGSYVLEIAGVREDGKRTEISRESLQVRK